MSDIIVIQPDENNVVVSEITNSITTASDGPQGPAGPTGATGATGPAGSSGVVAVTAPITNSGTSSSANIGISAGTTSAAGALQLEDSVASTSTTTAATPNAVKTAYDLTVTKMSGVKPVAASFIRTPINQLTFGVQNFGHQTMVLTPILISQSTTFDRMSIFTNSVTGSALTARLGIYSSNSNNQPSSLVLDAGTLTVAVGTYGRTDITINQTLTPGIYWLAYCQQGTAPSVSSAVLGALGSSVFFNALIQAVTGSPTNSNIIAYSVASITGALPSTVSSYSQVTICPYVWIRSA